MAIFETTKLNDGNLCQESFNSNHFKRGQLSVARLSFTKFADLIEFVAKPLQAANGKLIGLACARAWAIRGIKVRFPEGESLHRGICVIDRVDPPDHNGHATLGQSAYVAAVKNERAKMMVRQYLFADLADILNPIVSPPEIAFQLIIG